MLQSPNISNLDLNQEPDFVKNVEGSIFSNKSNKIEKSYDQRDKSDAEVDLYISSLSNDAKRNKSVAPVPNFPVEHANSEIV